MWTRHAPAGRLVNVTRIAWGVFFLGSAVFNALITAPNAAGGLKASAASTVGVILSKLRKLGIVEKSTRRIAPEFMDSIAS